MAESPHSQTPSASPLAKIEKIEPEIKAGKCGVTLYEYKCGHSTRYMAWNPLCGAHEKCDPHSAVMEVIDATCTRCGVVCFDEDGVEIKKEEEDDEDKKEGDVQSEYASSSLNGEHLKVISETFNPQEAANAEAISVYSRDSTPYSVNEDWSVRGALSDIEEEPAPIASVDDMIEMSSGPTPKPKAVEENSKVTKGEKKQEVTGRFEYIYSPVSNRAPIIKLPAEVHQHTDPPSTPARKNPGFNRNTKVASEIDEEDLAGGFEYLHSPVKKHVAKVRLPTERDDVSEVIKKSTKSCALQATAEPFVPMETPDEDEDLKITSLEDKYNDSELNNIVSEVTGEEVTVKLRATQSESIKVLDRCSRFLPLDAYTEVENETMKEKKPAKYTPPMVWKHASVSRENNENTPTAPKVKEGITFDGKSIHDDDQRASTHRVALNHLVEIKPRENMPPLEPFLSDIRRGEKSAPKQAYNILEGSLFRRAPGEFMYKKDVSHGMEHEEDYIANAWGQLDENRAPSAYPSVITPLDRMGAAPGNESRQASGTQPPRSSPSSNAVKSISNGVGRNKVPFLPSKPESVIIREETMDAEAEKLKKLQRTLATLAITQEVEVIFAKVQRDQKIKLEDWFSNVAPMHLAAMEKAAKQSRDRDTQIKALRASFADNGKFLGGMLVDQLLSDAKDEVIRMCVEGVEKLVNSLL